MALLAQLIKTVRHETVLQHEPSQGDSAWSLGCRAYARICHAIVKAAQSEWAEWLSMIEDSGLRFVFGIGGVPLRFYKGDAEQSKPRQLHRHYPEIQAQQLALEFCQAPEFDRVFRLAVETDELGEVESVTLVQLDLQGVPHNPWRIPLGDQPSVRPLRVKRTPVELPPPLAFPATSKKREEI